MLNKPIICIQGPTASGKSALAEELAHILSGEIVSADSMQIYKGMDIGTAKVCISKYNIPYHCINLIDPGAAYSAALFQQDARFAINSIQFKKKQAIVCGGTGLYVRAALDNMKFASGDQADNPVREKYNKIADEKGAAFLHALLSEKDPESAALVHPNNVKRVVRALEMFEAGESYAQRKNNFKSVEPYFPTIYLALKVDVDILNDRINKRVEDMLASGLLEEVRTLLEQGFRKGLTAQAAIGYKELVSFIDGECSFEDAVLSIKQATRRYAKRQRTWLRSDKRNIWLNASNGITDELVSEALKIIHKAQEK